MNRSYSKCRDDCNDTPLTRWVVSRLVLLRIPTVPDRPEQSCLQDYLHPAVLNLSALIDKLEHPEPLWGQVVGNLHAARAGCGQKQQQKGQGQHPEQVQPGGCQRWRHGDNFHSLAEVLSAGSMGVTDKTVVVGGTEKIQPVEYSPVYRCDPATGDTMKYRSKKSALAGGKARDRCPLFWHSQKWDSK